MTNAAEDKRPAMSKTRLEERNPALIGSFVLDKGTLRNWDGQYIANPNPEHAEGLLALLNLNAQHRSGIGEDEIVERILDIHYFDNVHFKKVKVTLRSIDGIKEELEKILRSHHTSSNTPSPEVIEKLVEALKYYADVKTYGWKPVGANRTICVVNHDGGDTARTALSLIDGENRNEKADPEKESA